MPSVDINWLALLVAAVVNMVVGALWYSPKLFGKPWAKLLGKKVGDMGDANIGYAVSAIGALVQVWVLVHFVRYAGALTFVKGAVVGFWLWLAFVAVVMAMDVVFEGRNWKFWQINAGYFLVVLLINGGLLAAWR
jgi:hypothetical protein